MEIVRRSQETAGLLPEAEAALRGAPAIPNYHLAHGLRPPPAIYGLSQIHLWPCFLEVLDAADQIVAARPFTDPKNLTWSNRFTSGYERLLYRLFEHLEDCRNILKCLFPDESALKTSAPARLFRKATADYRNHLGLIVNHIKHSQGRVDPLLFFSSDIVLPGYFVDGVGPDGVIGPDRRIHPGNGAFSVARDLRFHFVHVYLTSHHLARTVESILGAADDSDIPHEKHDTTIAAIAERLSGLPHLLYPDEIGKPFPSVGLHRFEDGAMRLDLRFPDTAAQLSSCAGMAVVAALSGDGVSRSFTFPYFRARK